MIAVPEAVVADETERTVVADVFVPPRCEDCGRVISARDIQDHRLLGGAPAGSIPRLCLGCAEEVYGGS
jgi:hypothetical protein